MSIGSLCRQYRIDSGLTLAEFCDDEISIKTVSAFEHDRSTNMQILFRYIRLATVRGDSEKLITNLIEDSLNG